jgi:hypothetical protein
MAKLTKNQKAGLIALAVIGGAVLAVTALRSGHKALAAEGAPARGDGRAMFREGDHVIVAAPAVTPEENAILAEVVTLLQEKAPGITWIPVALGPHPTFPGLDLTPLAMAAANLPANIGTDRDGVLLLWSEGIKKTAQGELSLEGVKSLNLVEVPVSGQVSSEERQYLTSIRNADHRTFGLQAEQPRQPPGPYVDALLFDLQNPAGLPNDRTV